VIRVARIVKTRPSNAGPSNVPRTAHPALVAAVTDVEAGHGRIFGAVFPNEPGIQLGDQMRRMTCLVMTSLLLALAFPARAQTIPVPASVVDTSVNVAAAAFVALTVPRTALPDSGQTAIGPGARDRRVAAHYSAARQSESPALVARQRAGLGQPMAMMVVGGTALLVGAIIGDTPGTIFMIGGAVIGLVGLYEYLQ
jgi:hypothetical protein